MRGYITWSLVLSLAACSDTATTPLSRPEQPLGPRANAEPVPSGYSIPIELPTLPGGTYGEATAINNSGVIAGFSWDATGKIYAVRWSGGAVTNLGTLAGHTGSIAEDMNSGGQVVGRAYAAAATWRAFRYSPKGGLVSLHNAYFGSTGAHAINDSGTAVGEGWWSGSGLGWSGGSDTRLPLRWAPNGALQVLGNQAYTGRALDISPSGVVVGAAQLSGWPGPRAFIWLSTGEGYSLGTLGGNRSEARAVNAQHVVVGTASTTSGEVHAFRWSYGSPMQDIGPVGNHSEAVDVSDRGRIVGNVPAAGGAFTWYNGQFSYLPPLSSKGHTRAHAVNACGTIVGRAANAKGLDVPVMWVRRVCD